MKSIFQLFYVTSDGVTHDVLFSNYEKAFHDMNTYYTKGSVIHDNLVVDRSFIVERILF